MIFYFGGKTRFSSLTANEMFGFSRKHNFDFGGKINFLVLGGKQDFSGLA